MQVLASKRDVERRNTLSAPEPHKCGKLSLYASPPCAEVALEDFERAALDRLRVLKGIENALSRGAKPLELDAAVSELESQYLSRRDLTTLDSSSEGELKDAVSHFVLRLAYCRTEELRRWFLTQECVLFKCRFKKLLGHEQQEFMRQNQLPYHPLAPAEYKAVEDKLATVMRATMVGQQATPTSTAWYRVPFEDVPELVRNRKVYLVKGSAYVPQEHIASLVVGLFRSRLSKALAVTARQWGSKIAPMEMERLTPIVEALSTRHLGATDYSQDRGAAGTVTLANLDELASKSFPLCMQTVFAKLKEEHHLRHFGRMQLGLFLKGIGLTLEDAMAFWKSEFTKRMPAEKFDKQYSYNVRHNYGKEGKRQDYTPYSCMKIIMSTPGQGDFHGCPYRHWTDDNVRAALSKMNLSQTAVNEVLDKKRSQHYQLACSAAFDGAHAGCGGCGNDGGPQINHPNQYFEESRKLIDGPLDTTSTPLSPNTPGNATAPHGPNHSTATPLAMPALVQ